VTGYGILVSSSGLDIKAKYRPLAGLWHLKLEALVYRVTKSLTRLETSYREDHEYHLRPFSLMMKITVKIHPCLGRPIHPVLDTKHF